MKTVYIEWVDSEGNDGWAEIEEENDDLPLIVHTVAYLLRITKHNYIVAHSLDISNNNVMGKLKIPKEAIVKIIEINLPNDSL